MIVREQYYKRQNPPNSEKNRRIFFFVMHWYLKKSPFSFGCLSTAKLFMRCCTAYRFGRLKLFRNCMIKKSSLFLLIWRYFSATGVLFLVMCYFRLVLSAYFVKNSCLTQAKWYGLMASAIVTRFYFGSCVPKHVARFCFNFFLWKTISFIKESARSELQYSYGNLFENIFQSAFLNFLGKFERNGLRPEWFKLWRMFQNPVLSDDQFLRIFVCHSRILVSHLCIGRGLELNFSFQLVWLTLFTNVLNAGGVIYPKANPVPKTMIVIMNVFRKFHFSIHAGSIPLIWGITWGIFSTPKTIFISLYSLMA